MTLPAQEIKHSGSETAVRALVDLVGNPQTERLSSLRIPFHSQPGRIRREGSRGRVLFLDDLALPALSWSVPIRRWWRGSCS